MKQIQVRDGQSVVDIAIQEYGSIEGMPYLIQDNPGLDYSTDLVPKAYLNIREVQFKQTVNRLITAPKLVDQIAILVRDGQNSFDIATQIYGSWAGAFTLVKDNAINSITDDLQIGTNVKAFLSKFSDLYSMQFYRNKGLQVVSNVQLAYYRIFSDEFDATFN